MGTDNEGQYWRMKYQSEKARADAAEAALRDAVLAEREACAKVCEAHAATAWEHEGGALNCAEQIRHRSHP